MEQTSVVGLLLLHNSLIQQTKGELDTLKYSVWEILLPLKIDNSNKSLVYDS